MRPARSVGVTTLRLFQEKAETSLQAQLLEMTEAETLAQLDLGLQAQRAIIDRDDDDNQAQQQQFIAAKMVEAVASMETDSPYVYSVYAEISAQLKAKTDPVLERLTIHKLTELKQKILGNILRGEEMLTEEQLIAELATLCLPDAELGYGDIPSSDVAWLESVKSNAESYKQEVECSRQRREKIKDFAQFAALSLAFTIFETFNHEYAREKSVEVSLQRTGDTMQVEIPLCFVLAAAYANRASLANAAGAVYSKINALYQAGKACVTGKATDTEYNKLLEEFQRELGDDAVLASQYATAIKDNITAQQQQHGFVKDDNEGPSSPVRRPRGMGMG